MEIEQPKLRPKLSVNFDANPEAYEFAKERCKTLTYKQKSKCIRTKFIERCKNENENQDAESCFNQNLSRMEIFKQQKWVYLRPYLNGLRGEGKEIIGCGTIAARRGHACRPTVEVNSERAHAKTIDQLLNDKDWLKDFTGSNLKKLNRLAAYKDARGSRVIMFWSRGKFFDKVDKTSKSFHAYNEMSEQRFRSLLRRFNSQIALEFEDLNGP
jgi:hypothetical protein